MSYKEEVEAFVKVTKNAPFFVFDTETTGLSPVESDIIQFSAVKCELVDGTYQITNEFNTYINPGYPIPTEITGLTGITDEMVKDAPDAKTAAKRIYAFLGKMPILAGYNSISFDTRFMQQLYRKNLGIEFESLFHLDVLKMARDKFEKPHKLIDMAERAGVSEKYAFHSSLDDAKATFDVLNFILPEYEKPEAKGMEVTITDIRQWKKSDTLNRLYVSNKENKSIYFDLYTKEWVIPPDVEEQSVIEQVYRQYQVANASELAVYFQ